MYLEANCIILSFCRYGDMQNQKNSLNNSKYNSNQMAHWTNRALFILSFKEAHTQNLLFITKALGITAPNERKEYVKELLKMVQRGIIYVPKGLPYLIEQESKFNLDNPVDLESIELCLLHPLEKLISELRAELPTSTTEEITFEIH